MWFAMGAVSSVLDGLQSLGSAKSGSAQQQRGSGSGIFDFVGGSSNSSAGFNSALGTSSGSAPIAPDTLSALIAAQGDASTSAASGATSSSAADPLQQLFSQIDANGDGQISKSEFEKALGASGSNVATADSMFDQLDKNGDGSISVDEMKSAPQGGGHHGHSHRVAGSSGSDGSGAGGSGSDALSDGSTSSTINSDGSTTTTVTYADGSTVTTTTAAATTQSGKATSSYNQLEKLISNQANALAASVSTTAISA
jgi:hypothetical protein